MRTLGSLSGHKPLGAGLSCPAMPMMNLEKDFERKLHQGGHLGHVNMITTLKDERPQT